jgi:superfamily II DNA or RNA helicase
MGKGILFLLSVHTLEIGYDIPQAAIAIIISSTSNIYQIIQRIGRVIRKFEGKIEHGSM